jgi:hypothetical protein
MRTVPRGFVMASIRILLILSCVFAAPAALAGEAPSAVVVEGLSLPAHLDAFHARARESVGKALESGGWRVIEAGQSACRETSCAAQLAREANATFAVIVDGKYRTGGYDLRVQVWNGQEMVVDQSACEDCTGPEFVTRLQTVVASLVETENRKRAAAEAVAPATAARGRAPVPTLPARQSQPTPAPPIGSSDQARRTYVAPLGWALIAGGIAAAAGGGYLLWANGRLESCVDTSAGTRNCSRQSETHGGMPLAIGGASIVAIGGALLVYNWRAAPREVTVRIGPASLTLAGNF